MKMNKKYLMFGIPMLCLVLVSAGLVTYWGQTQVDMKVTEAITVNGEVCDFSTIAGGDYKLCLFNATNNLDRKLDADFTIKVQKWNGANYVTLYNDEGLLIAATEDVQYYFDPNHGSCDGPNENGCGPASAEQTMKEWMLQFPNELDWVVTQPYAGEYDTTLITNNNGDSVLEVSLVNGKYTTTETIDASDNFQIALYVDSATGLEAGYYRVILEVAPVTVA